MAISTRRSKPKGTSAFDVDSVLVWIDYQAAACMSHVAQDFVGPMVESNRVVKAFRGTQMKNVVRGVICRKIEDDSGMVHAFTIPNSYYVPDGGVRTLSPQHWSAAQKYLSRITERGRRRCITSALYSGINRSTQEPSQCRHRPTWQRST